MGYSLDVSYQGPLYDGRDHSKGKVRIDMNRRPEAVEIRRELVASPYDDIRPFVVIALTPEHLLAEKVRALVVRGKPRDPHHFWLLLRQGIEPDPALIERKLALYQLSWRPDLILERLDAVRVDWERDLRPLLPQYVSFEDALRGVESLLK